MPASIPRDRKNRVREAPDPGVAARDRVRVILSQLRQHVDNAEAEYRRTYLPAPTREHPRHDPVAIRNAQLIEGIGRDIGTLEGQVRTFPISDAAMAVAGEADQALIDHAEFLHALLAPVDGAWIAANADEVRGLIDAVRVQVHERASFRPGTP